MENCIGGFKQIPWSLPTERDDRDRKNWKNRGGMPPEAEGRLTTENFIDKKLQMQNIIINFVASKYEKNGKYGDYKGRRPKNHSAT